MKECKYPSLTSLPNTKLDPEGFLNLANENIRERGLRPRYKYLIKLSPEALKGTKLSELLNWFRWAAENTVMWDCTAKEMVVLIERWEHAHPEANAEQYGIHPDPQATWDLVWKHAQAINTWIEIVCKKCKKSHDNAPLTCPGREFEQERHGPRGKGTYNLVFEGVNGCGIAEAAFLTRGEKRRLPNFNLF